MELELQGKRAIVTGASTGIGYGVALELAKAGCDIALVARRQQRLSMAADQIQAVASSRILTIAGDLSLVDEPGRIANSASNALGAIDILINCAGGASPAKVNDKPAVWQEAMDLNFTSARLLSEILLPSMCARRWGRIVNMSGSMEPRALNAASAAKAALHLWAKGLSCEIAKLGVTVNTVAPGRIHSEQIRNNLHPTESARQAFIDAHIPIGYFGEPSDVGHLVAFLCSPLARYITGAVIPVDGGMHYFAH